MIAALPRNSEVSRVPQHALHEAMGGDGAPCVKDPSGSADL